MTSTYLARTALPCAFVLSVTFFSPAASAQVDAGAIDTGVSDDAATTPAALSATDFAFSIQRYDALAGSWVKLNPTEQAFFFDRARCECAADTSNFTGSIRIAIEPSAAAVQKIAALLVANSTDSGTARIYAGSDAANCLTAESTTAPANCLNLLDPSNYSASIPGGMAVFLTQRIWESPPIPVAWLFGAAQTPVCNSPQSCSQTSACGVTTAVQTIYFWAQTSTAAQPDRSDLSFTVNLAGLPPSGPTNLIVEAANESLLVQWGWPASINPAANPSFLGIQLFCQRGQGHQVFSSGTYAPAFTRSAALCPAVAPASANPPPFANLAPSFLCSDLLPTTATSYRIAGLQNGVPYGVGVAAVDKYGNLTPIAPTDVVYQVPNASAASLDGGVVDGGVRQDGGGGCALAGRQGARDASTSISLLVLGALFLRRARSRRRRPSSSAARVREPSPT